MSVVIPRAQTGDYIGFETEPTAWLKIEQPRIDAFADVTEDHQFIHVDPAKASESPFGTTIAHGFLTLSLLSHFAESFGVKIEGVVMGINYGFDKVRFLNPVKVDSEIRARARVLDINEKNPGQYMIKYEITVEINGEDKPALLAEWLTMQVVH
ncbi:MaoC family dehydratase [Gilvimarinus sp. F26214L]|uniref:MaoC family dehydratase n=1 Tax=Gilvimarinus sp. DZF01 TaxID=3461371 RepID=UPI004045A830